MFDAILGIFWAASRTVCDDDGIALEAEVEASRTARDNTTPSYRVNKLRDQIPTSSTSITHERVDRKFDFTRVRCASY